MDSAERQRRIVAARTLRGLSQSEMDRRGHDWGLDKQELSRLERGEFGERFTDAQRNALCSVLGAAEWWFTAESVDDLLGTAGSAAPGSDALGVLEEFLPELHEVAQALRQGREATGRSPGGTGRQGQGKGGNGP